MRIQGGGGHIPCPDEKDEQFRDRTLERIAELEAEIDSLHAQLEEYGKLPTSKRIAELVDELATVNALLDMKREREQHWNDEAWKYRERAEQAEAENRQLAHDLAKFPPRRERIAELEAENERLKVCGNCAESHDIMLRLVFEQEELPIAWQQEKYEAWLADLRNRVGKQAED